MPVRGGRSRWCVSEELALADSESTEFFPQLQQAVAPLAGGGFVAAWIEGTHGNGRVRMQWLDPSGRPLGPAGGLVVAGPPDDVDSPVAVAGSSEDAYVAFRSNGSVVVQRFVAGRPRWPGASVPAVDGSGEVAAEPHLVANPGVGVFVCFESWAGGPVLDIRCQSLDSSGERLWTSRGVSAGDAGAEVRVLPRGVSDGEGGLLLFWRNQRDLRLENPGPMLMEGQRFAADGSRPWGPAPKVVRTTNLASSNGYTYTSFQVVSDGGGGAVLAFNDWTGVSDRALDVLAQRVSGAGGLLWGEGAVVTGVDGPQQHDQTIGTGDGGAVIAVDDIDPASGRFRLLLFRLAPDGAHAWSPSGVPLADPGSFSDYAAFGSYDGGVLRLAWTRQNVPAAWDIDVPFATFDAAGARTGTTLLTRAPGARFLRGLAFSPVTGSVMAVWDDRRKGTFDDLDAGAVLLFGAMACPTAPAADGAAPSRP